MSIYKHWTPVNSVKTDDGFEVSVLNRKYTLSKESTFFSSVTSLGKELLCAPMRIVAENKGVPCEFCDAKTIMMTGATDETVNYISTYQSDFVIVNVSHKIEFDGCDELTLSVMPTGMSVAACFGLEEFDSKAFDLNKLWLEIPLKGDIFKFYNYAHATNLYNFNNMEEADKEFVNNWYFMMSGEIPKSGMHLSNLTQIYLNGYKMGLGLFFESDENFKNDDSTRVVEIVPDGDDWILRVRFFDSTPDFWLDKGKDNANSRGLIPIQFHFGMMVTPVKDTNNKSYTERCLHIDCFKKIPINYEEFLSNPVVEGDDEIGFDRIKRLGVEVLYLHEKWNDIQNSFDLTTDSAERLRYIVSECHKRGIKVVPYFGYEISTLSPVYQKCGRKYVAANIAGGKTLNTSAGWYRYPYQRDMRCCYGGGYGEMFADGIIKLQKEFNFDGFYFDGTASPLGCGNLEHGCGWVDSTGAIHKTSPQFAIRSMMKKIYKHTSENNLIINHHNSFYSMCCCGFMDSNWVGEGMQSALLNGKIKRIPEWNLMAKYTARDIGVPTYSLCYSREGVWEYENAASVALLFGSMPKPVDIGKPLEYMSKIWDIYDSFPMEDAEFIPYYCEGRKVESDNDGIKVSVYQTSDKALAVCSSIHKEFDGDAVISTQFKKITDAMTGTVLSTDGKTKIHLGGFEAKILIME